MKNQKTSMVIALKDPVLDIASTAGGLIVTALLTLAVFMVVVALLMLLGAKFQSRLEKTALSGSPLGNIYARRLNGFTRVKRLHDAVPVSSEDLLSEPAETANWSDEAISAVRPQDE